MADLPPRQIVRLTRCIIVSGHPAKLIEMMSFVGYRWYPEYTVEEQFRDFNQTQYHCIVRIYPHHIGVTQPVLFGHGIGNDREHGCAGCCILMYESAERGARLAERHF